ncbi:MAG TPA: transcription termination/antitermination protein NusA [Lentisphaeria bacterium]|nr:MAG: transcription termination factor NusA [Lentisphaerae bacterium GWF2_38_69]HBM17178.1 transcription termination/antitermination protein NusA [Lentisphaeria bacterium]
MAGNELLSLLEYVEQERGISRDELIEALEKSLASAARKSIEYGKEIRVKVNRLTGLINAYVDFEVSEGSTKGDYINIEEAKKLRSDAKVGEIVSKDIPKNDFGRIAAQTARQTMLQQLKKAEKARVFEDFKNSIGLIVSGIVRRFDAGNVILDFQKAEGIISSKDKIPGDNFIAGERVNALLAEINTSGSGPSLILTRTNRNFLRRLFEREITEIADGTVEIKGIARDPGSRAKVSVISHNQRVDPIGACIGLRGSRVKNVMAEIGGERIDIIRYDEDITQYITNALQPAVPGKVDYDHDNKMANVYVNKEQIKLAIGKNWQNAKLVGQLLGIRVNIFPEEETESLFEKQINEAVRTLAESLSVHEDIAKILVNNGFVTPEGLRGAEKSDLMTIEGLNEEIIDAIFKTIGKTV